MAELNDMHREVVANTLRNQGHADAISAVNWDICSRLLSISANESDEIEALAHVVKLAIRDNEVG